MTTNKEIIEANRKSALEQEPQDEENDATKASMQADALINGRPPRRKFTSIGNIDRTPEALSEVERSNMDASNRRIHRYDEQNG